MMKNLQKRVILRLYTEQMFLKNRQKQTFL